MRPQAHRVDGQVLLVEQPRLARQSHRLLQGVMDDPVDTCDVAAGLVALTEGAVKDVDAIATRLRQAGKSKARVKGIVDALTPWARKLSRAA